jgi:hypothetical protein
MSFFNVRRCGGSKELSSIGFVMGTAIRLSFILGHNIGGKLIIFRVFVMSKDGFGGKKGILAGSSLIIIIDYFHPKDQTMWRNVLDL